MKKEALSLFPHIDWNLYISFLFIILFSSILIWIFRKGSKSHYQQMSNMPFGEEGTSNEHR